MGLKLEEIKILIKEALPDAEITIKDLAGDENHYSATIRSKEFNISVLDLNELNSLWFKNYFKEN